MLNQDSETESPKISDGCPDWAEVLIRKIYLLEIETGAIPNPKNGQWSTQTQDDLMKIARKLEGNAGSDADEEADSLFIKVARGLMDAGLAPEIIAKMINDRIPTGTRLSYCSPAEILGSVNN